MVTMAQRPVIEGRDLLQAPLPSQALAPNQENTVQLPVLQPHRCAIERQLQAFLAARASESTVFPRIKKGDYRTLETLAAKLNQITLPLDDIADTIELLQELGNETDGG